MPRRKPRKLNKKNKRKSPFKSRRLRPQKPKKPKPKKVSGEVKIEVRAGKTLVKESEIYSLPPLEKPKPIIKLRRRLNQNQKKIAEKPEGKIIELKKLKQETQNFATKDLKILFTNCCKRIAEIEIKASQTKNMIPLQKQH